MNLLEKNVFSSLSPSHLVFSRLSLNRERSFLNPTNRFMLVDREIIYESEIIFTPLLDRYTIDIESIINFCEEEYQKAGITPEMVDSGAVVVTGETAKKQNADCKSEEPSGKCRKCLLAIHSEEAQKRGLIVWVPKSKEIQDGRRWRRVSYGRYYRPGEISGSKGKDYASFAAKIKASIG